jgi:hypothetical protein
MAAPKRRKAAASFFIDNPFIFRDSQTTLSLVDTVTRGEVVL